MIGTGNCRGWGNETMGMVLDVAETAAAAAAPDVVVVVVVVVVGDDDVVVAIAAIAIDNEVDAVKMEADERAEAGASGGGADADAKSTATKKHRFSPSMRRDSQ